MSTRTAESGASPVSPAVAQPATSLRGRAARGSVWTLLSFVVGNVLRLGSNLVLAHALFPEAFALVAIASIVLQALQMLSDVGIGAAIVQSPRGDDPAFLNTAWTFQVLRGLLLFIVSGAVAWPVAWFYSTPELVWVIPACALSFVSTGFQSTSLYTQGRDLELARITILGFCETLIKTAITVAWALIWPSVWAIIGGSLISYILFMIATHTLLPGPRNRFQWEPEAVKYLSGFGRWVFASTTVTFLAMQSDRLILGKLATLEVLGVYSIAYMFAKLPYDVCSRLTSQVQFPALAEVHRRDPSRLHGKLIESRRLILAITQFGLVGTIVLSPWFFGTLYDSRYADAAAFSPMLAIAVWFSILQASCDRALLAIGDAKSLAMSNAANCLVTLSACIVGYRVAGIQGFIIAVGAGNFAGHFMVVLSLARHRLHVVGQDLLYTALVGAVFLAAMVGPALFAGHSWSGGLRIAVGVAGLAASASCMTWVAWPHLRGPILRGVAMVRSVKPGPAASSSQSTE